MASSPTPDPYAAAVAPSPAPPRKSRWRWLWRALALLAVLLVALLAGLWWWSGSSSSLNTVVERAARYLPEGQQLQAEGVTGSLRTGGHIDRLRWSNATLAVEARDIDIGWSLAPLLERQLKLGEVHAASVTLTAHGDAPEDDGPPEPLQELVLPIHIDLPFRIDHLLWTGRGPDAKPIAIDDLAGRYRYDGEQHQLTVDHVELAQGRYGLEATLGARAPMELQASLNGAVRSAVPGSEATLQALASAQVTGTLAGREARLDVTGQLRGSAAPASSADEAQDAKADEAASGAQASAAPDANAPLRADVQARIAPWLAQPLEKAQADVQGLNLALLWPQAPATLLDGHAAVLPEGEGGWRIDADLTNAESGPWDRQHLPVQALQAEATYDGETWDVPRAHLQAGGGSIDAHGRYTPATQSLEAEARLAGVNPAQLYSRLAPAPLSGTASASGSASGDSAVRFAADLRAAPAPRRARAGKAGDLAAIALQRLATEGRWHEARVDIPRLLLQAEGAQVQAQQLQIDTRTLAVRGRMQAQVPGATLQTDGRMAPDDGAGTLALKLADAQRLQGWLAQVGTPPLGLALDGRADLDAQWRGGWQSAQRQLQGAGLLAADASPATGPAGAFTLQATLRAPQLRLTRAAQGDAGALNLEFARTSASLRGGLSDLSIDYDGVLRQGGDQQQADVHLRATAASQGSGRWRARVGELRVQARMKDQPGPWTLRLAEPVTVDLQQQPRLTVEASAASARLTGPEPGEVQLRWQPLRYAQGAQGGMELTSQGTLQGLPLAWANAFQTDGQGALAKLNVSGNLVLSGNWDVAATPGGLRARAGLRRTSGDIRMLTSGALDAPGVTVVRSSGEGQGAGAPKADTSATTSAGLRELALEVAADGNDVRANLSWDSARAGRVQADGSTRLVQSADGGWQWPADAPLAAQVRAELPEVGVWSVLAPPGWRVQGTLSADVRLSGSRSAPQWNGQLAADRFAIRSLLDGVDLQDGRLRATLQGEQLTITELHLKGGRGSRARIAGYSGNRTAAPLDGGTLDGGGTLSWAGAAGGEGGLSGIRMDLRARAKALQVLVRADRQVSVSGDLNARLQGGQVVLRGDLTVDRATIILPEAGAPSLGDDVVVRSAALDKAAAEKAQKAAKRAQGSEQPGSVQAARTPDVAVKLDLGQDFALQGRGVTTRLTGQLAITSSAATAGQPRVTGEVRTEQGRYRAWGQSLDIETGLLRFNGPYDNPALDVLALRPNIPVRAGVQVTGSAQAPRVRLYSEPEMPDAEKLSWVVLGRSAAGGGAEAALLQQAALAFLSGDGSKSSSGGIAQRLGLDEIGFKGPGQGEDASSAALTLGKRLSRDLYVTYERSLSGAMGTLFIFYDLSKRLTLRGQTGEKSAVDLIYTVRYD